MANINLSGSIGTTGTAILGSVDVVLTDANKTLTVTEYTNNFINVTGTLTTQRDIILPLVKGLSFIVNNATTGGFSIRAIGATGTGVTINNGNRLLAICDGDNYLTISIIDSVGGDLGDFLPNPTVRKLWTVSVPQVLPSNPTATTGFVVGNVLQVSNVTANNQALVYGALNLGTNGTTSTNTSGILPVARQAPQNLTGDLSGFANSSGGSFNSNFYGATVTKIQNTAVQFVSMGSQQDGYVLTYNNANGRWEPQSSLTGASLSGDVTGQPGTNTLSKIQTKTLLISSLANGHVLTYNSTFQRWENVDHLLSGDLGGTLNSGTVIKIRGNPVAAQSLGLAQDGYVLTWDNSSGNWKADVTASGSLPGGTATGDLAGFYPGPSVIAINGTSVPAAPNANTVLKATSTTAATWGFIVEANITGGTITNTSINIGAAIAGTKISPNFGSQAITTSGTITSTASTITAPTFGVNNGSTIPTITSGTGVPTSTPPNGSVFYRTDGTDVSAIYTRQSSAWFPVGAAASGSAGGDLSGNFPNPTVIALQQNPVDNTLLGATQDGYVLTWNNATSRWLAKIATAGSSVTFAGDLSGTSSTQTVLKINGSTVPAGGALTTGNVLKVSGSSALTYGAVNLGGGSDHVTGTLPTANQANQIMGGDASGNTGATTVIAIQNNPILAGTPTDGYVLTYVTANGRWEPKVAASGSFSASGDLSGTSSSQTVIRINGATVPAAGSLVTGNILYVTGTSTLAYAALNLGGGSNFVTGILPAGNQASQNMGGDVTGSTSISTVIKLQNIDVLSGTPTDGYLLTYVAANTRWEYMPPSSAGAAGGDLFGSYPNPTVIKLQNINVLAGTPTDGYVLTYVTANSRWEAQPTNSGVIFGGDLSGSLTSQTVIKINGASVPVSGSLVTGNVLKVSGTSALSYGAVNLAGGANHVTGVLPTANQAAQTMGGDVTGTTAASTVTKLQNVNVAAGTPTDGYVLTYSLTNGQWEPQESTTGSGGIGFYEEGVLVATRPKLNVVGGTATVVDNPGNNWVDLIITSSGSGSTDRVDFNGYGVIQSGYAEVGQYISHARFKALYDFSPVSVTLDDNDGNATKDVSGTPGSFFSDGYFQKNTFGQSVTFTLTADGYTDTFQVKWAQRNYYGLGPTGSNSAAFITGLNSDVSDTVDALFTVNAGATDKIYYAHRTGYGTPTFYVNGFEGGFTLVSTTISLTNPYGFAENYTLYESDNVGLGITSVEVF
jgi:hypothetical protein